MNHQILKTIDNPIRVLFWDIQEFLVIVIPIFAGIGCGHLLLMISGLPLKILYKKLKKRFPHGSLKHLLYWYLPRTGFGSSSASSGFPPSYLRMLLL